MQDFSPSHYYLWTGLLQNCVGHLVTRTRKKEHITPVLCQLHWLCVRFRSLYMIPFLTFIVLNRTAPEYLSDLIEKYMPVRLLRSESYSLLRVPRSHTGMYGGRSVRATAPRLGNELPNHIKLAASKDIFCKVLKTLDLNWRIYCIKPVYNA